MVKEQQAVRLHRVKVKSEKSVAEYHSHTRVQSLQQFKDTSFSFSNKKPSNRQLFQYVFPNNVAQAKKLLKNK